LLSVQSDLTNPSTFPIALDNSSIDIMFPFILFFL